jgi:4a-hydroxytetrahydrobiopterin dehydratase
MVSADGEPGYITSRQFREAEGTGDWPVLSNAATAFFPTESLGVASRFVVAIAGLEGTEGHLAGIDIRPDGVTVRVVTATADWWGMSWADVELVRRISAVARELGLVAESSIVQSVDPIVIGAVDIARVMPFWQALMGYVRRADSPEEDLVDPRGIGPGIWFERIAEGGRGRNRMHVAVWVPPGEAETRVAAAVVAGGRVIYDAHAPAWWTLVDPEGNEADVSTSMSREG